MQPSNKLSSHLNRFWVGKKRRRKLEDIKRKEITEGKISCTRRNIFLYIYPIYI